MPVTDYTKPQNPVQDVVMPSWYTPEMSFDDRLETEANARLARGYTAGATPSAKQSSGAPAESSNAREFRGYATTTPVATNNAGATVVNSTPPAKQKPVFSAASVGSPLKPMTPDERANVPMPVQPQATSDNASTESGTVAATSAPSAPSAPAAPRPASLGDYYRQMSAATLARYGDLAPDLDKADTALKTAQAQQQASYDKLPFRPLGFYEQLTKTLNPYRPPTAAEIQRRIKREKGQKTIAAIGDGIAALANLFGTSQGALNAYDGANSLSGRYAQMYETLRQERKANDEKYYASYLNALAADDANAAAIRGNEATKQAVNVQNAQTSYASLLSMLDKLRDKADKYDKLASDQDTKDRDFQLRVETLQQRAADNEANRELRRDIAAQSDATRREIAASNNATRRELAYGSRALASAVRASREDAKYEPVLLYTNKDSDPADTGIRVPKTKWNNEKWIESVYNYAYTRMGNALERKPDRSKGEKYMGRGAYDLMTNRKRGSHYDKQMTINHILTSAYDPGAQAIILEAIARYNQ